MVDDLKETACEMVSTRQKATFCSSESKWIKHMLRLKEQYPDDVKIDYMPQDNGGVLLAHIPKKWMKITPPRKVNLTDEQRAERAARLKSIKQSV